MKKGFTFIEITVVLFIISAISIGFIQNLRKAQRSHRTNTMIQEMMVLRNAFFAYYESKGGFEDIALTDLSDASFAKLKPYWYPFNAAESKVIEHKTSWKAATSITLEDTYLQLSSTEDLNLLIGEIYSLTRNLCKIVLGADNKTCNFYIFKAFDAE